MMPISGALARLPTPTIRDDVYPILLGRRSRRSTQKQRREKIKIAHANDALGRTFHRASFWRDRPSAAALAAADHRS